MTIFFRSWAEARPWRWMPESCILRYFVFQVFCFLQVFVIIYSYTHMYIHLHIHAHVYTSTHTRTCIYIDTYTHMYIHRHIHAHAYTSIYTYTHMHIHRHVHIHAYTSTHTRTRTRSEVLSLKSLKIYNDIIFNLAIWSLRRVLHCLCSPTQYLFSYLVVPIIYDYRCSYNAGQKLSRQTRKTASYLTPQVMNNQFKWPTQWVLRHLYYIYRKT